MVSVSTPRSVYISTATMLSTTNGSPMAKYAVGIHVIGDFFWFITIDYIAVFSWGILYPHHERMTTARFWRRKLLKFRHTASKIMLKTSIYGLQFHLTRNICRTYLTIKIYKSRICHNFNVESMEILMYICTDQSSQTNHFHLKTT